MDQHTKEHKEWKERQNKYEERLKQWNMKNEKKETEYKKKMDKYRSEKIKWDKEVNDLKMEMEKVIEHANNKIKNDRYNPKLKAIGEEIETITKSYNNKKENPPKEPTMPTPIPKPLPEPDPDPEPQLPKYSSGRGDPHFIGLDGNRYDVMPNGSAVYFQYASEFCITCSHRKDSDDPHVPSWIIGVIIQLNENVMSYDINGQLLLNNVPGPVAYVFSDGSYYILDKNTLTVWHVKFGRVMVDNCVFNMNIAFIPNPKILKEKSKISGLLLGKSEVDKKQLLKSPTFLDMDAQKFHRQHPNISKKDVSTLFFDYQYTPIDIRDKVLMANFDSIELQQKMIFEETGIDLTSKVWVHFSGGFIGNPDWGRNVSALFVHDVYSDILEEGEYKDQVCLNALRSTLDGIAVDSKTRLIIYPEENFEGNPLLNVVGPCIIWNAVHKNYYSELYDLFLKSDSLGEKYDKKFPQSVRSLIDMSNWKIGSVVVSDVTNYDSDEYEELLKKIEKAQCSLIK